VHRSPHRRIGKTHCDFRSCCRSMRLLTEIEMMINKLIDHRHIPCGSGTRSSAPWNRASPPRVKQPLDVAPSCQLAGRSGWGSQKQPGPAAASGVDEATTGGGSPRGPAG